MNDKQKIHAILHLEDYWPADINAESVAVQCIMLMVDPEAAMALTHPQPLLVDYMLENDPVTVGFMANVDDARKATAILLDPSLADLLPELPHVLQLHVIRHSKTELEVDLPTRPPIAAVLGQPSPAYEPASIWFGL